MVDENTTVGYINSVINSTMDLLNSTVQTTTEKENNKPSEVWLIIGPIATMLCVGSIISYAFTRFCCPNRKRAPSTNDESEQDTPPKGKVVFTKQITIRYREIPNP